MNPMDRILDAEAKAKVAADPLPSLYAPKAVGVYGNILIVFDPKNKADWGHIPLDTLTDDLKKQVQLWTDDPTITAVWANVHYEEGHVLPLLYKAGFTMHSIREEEYVVLSKWLIKDIPSRLPQSGTHVAGACGMVLRDKDEGSGEKQVLLIREKYRSHQWEFPAGSVERGEYMVDCATKEVWEETGLRVRPLGFVGIWESLNTRFGCSNTFGCVVFDIIPPPSNNDNTTPTTTTTTTDTRLGDALNFDTSEIVEGRWFDVREVLADPKNVAGYPVRFTEIHFLRMLPGARPLPTTPTTTATTTTATTTPTTTVANETEDRAWYGRVVHAVTDTGYPGYFYLP
eukprot:TRINITY_DN2106_c0_g1_i2.p1 TRINITY_DN2106_c0_g1~~TRINITY_DN2106_c0_g1_i2.p1  ORF type:complete len:343 (+),score=87.07 TRINITY_DN2106_c0_g1_i2:14-1042(+)